MKTTTWALAFITMFIAVTSAQASFYSDDAVYFAFRPGETRGGQVVNRFGPVGLSIELTLPAFGMKIKDVEVGSPAAEAGLKKGLIIDSI